MMKTSKIFFAAAALCASMAANANVTGSLGGGYGSFLQLSTDGLGVGGAIATRSGGAVYTVDRPFADIPAGVIFGGPPVTFALSTSHAPTVFPSQ